MTCDSASLKVEAVVSIPVCAEKYIEVTYLFNFLLDLRFIQRCLHTLSDKI